MAVLSLLNSRSLERAQQLTLIKIKKLTSARCFWWEIACMLLLSVASR